MYVKSTDGAGFPAIRAFAFQPIENPTPQTQQYVTREEFNDTLAKLKEAIGNGKQPVREQRETASKYPFQTAMAAAPELKHSNPEQLMEKMMEANPQFAAFVNQNKGKSPEQIARENGIDFNMVQKMFK